MYRPVRLGGAFLAFWCAVGSFGQESLETLEREGIERIAEGKAVESRVADISERTRKLREAYEDQLKLVQGLETYIELLDTQLAGQRNEIEVLGKSITDVAVLERQVLPLMLRMIDSLETFVDLDVPFLETERRQRIEKLRALMGRSDVTVAEKCRRVFEAYQVENEYGRKIDSYQDIIELDGARREVDVLRFGRIALVAQTRDAATTAVWDHQAGAWELLDAGTYRNSIRKGIQMARKQASIDLVTLPVAAPEVAK